MAVLADAQPARRHSSHDCTRCSCNAPLATLPASTSLQVAGCGLSTLRFWQGSTLDLGAEDGAPQHLPLPTLALGCCVPDLALSELLGFLQPAGAPPRTFERLELGYELPDPDSAAECTQLGQLSELAVAGMSGEPQDGTFQQRLAAILQQTTRLQSLAVCSGQEDATISDVPDCLASYSRLTSLSLTGQHLEQLPAGPYLTGEWGCDLCLTGWFAAQLRSAGWL